eukprot:TRINITY_DN36651_c0_g1_i1.p1 TRINITY_DN36651_c0_g1~~TRINITY_DN36651_c0_g1_i1.p1  ORF type:complete len:338 (+),score=104.87 TRINITY_DN36651_c0_g1_i1:96-1109(+)
MDHTDDERDTALFTGFFTTSFLSSQTQVVTILTILIHFLHPLLCISNYLDWVRHQSEVLDSSIVDIYLALCIIAILSFLLVASVFYFWALRYASDEDAAKRRRIYGIVVNLLFSDFPLFALEVDICWTVQFATGLQALSFLFTILSFTYSAFRVWIFVMVRCIKTQQPTEHLGGDPRGQSGFSGPYGGGSPIRGYTGTGDVSLASGYPTAAVPHASPLRGAEPRVPSFTEGATTWSPRGLPAHAGVYAPQGGVSALNPIGGVFAPPTAEPIVPLAPLPFSGSPQRAGGIVPAGSDPLHQGSMLAGAHAGPAGGVVPQVVSYEVQRGGVQPSPFPLQP